ncbi:MAG TPA: DUF2461 domain-containing protein [Gammaproteobacteria bacterium]
MPAVFNGFPKDLFKFLQELAKHNNREWFHANKARYQSSIVEPMCDFIQAMAYRFDTMNIRFVADPRPHGGSMFRIYRDTRFSNDKRPYKHHVACHFRHEAGKDAHAPGFYVHLEPGAVFFGGGIWMPPNPVLEKIRNTLVENPNAWKRIINNSSFKKRFGGLEDSGRLQRVPRGFDKNHPYAEDLKRKSFFVTQDVDPALALTPKFITEVERAFKTAGPLMKYLLFAMGLPYDRED